MDHLLSSHEFPPDFLRLRSQLVGFRAKFADFGGVPLSHEQVCGKSTNQNPDNAQCRGD
jgi:hypothetical protein